MILGGRLMWTEKKKFIPNKYRNCRITGIDFERVHVVGEYFAPVVQLVQPTPWCGHRNGQDDQCVRVIGFVEGELEQIGVAWIAVQHPDAQSCEVCKTMDICGSLLTCAQYLNSKRALTVAVFVSHINVCVLEARALLGVLHALQLGDERRLAGRIVAQHQHGFVGRQLGAALLLHLAKDLGPVRRKSENFF